MHDLVRITPLRARLRCFRERHLDAHDGFGICFRLRSRVAQQSKDFLDVLYIAFPIFFRLRIILGVVVAVRKAEPALIDGGDLLVGVVGILEGTGAEQDLATEILELQMSYHRRKVCLGLDRGDGVELRLDGREAAAVHGCFVHARPVEVADFLIYGIAIFRGGGAFQDRTQQREVVFV